MKYECWIGDGCTGSSLFDHTSSWYTRYTDIARDRREFVRVNEKNWPFVHSSVVEVNYPWYKKNSWGLDPLVIPILGALNAAGIQTISSCQGGHRDCPHILFTADADGVETAQRIASFGVLDRDNRCPWDEPMVVYRGIWPDRYKKPIWDIFFHDPIALMSWNLAAGIGLEDQVSNYKQGANRIEPGSVAVNAADLRPLFQHLRD